MTKISIDLLPGEFRVQELKRAKFLKVQGIGIGVILVIIFFSSLIVALRVLQSQRISQEKANLNLKEERITSLKDTQVSLTLLKNRLTSIEKYLGIPSNQADIFNLVDKLLPPTLRVSSVTVSRDGTISILTTTSDGDSFDNLITALISRESNDGKIASVSLDSFSRGKDGIFRVNFKITPKKK